MQSIGERLKEGRTRKGISIREAAEATKIRTDFLERMESNQFDKVELPEVYRHGFLKVYARYLKMDDEQLATDYRALKISENKGFRKDHSTKEFFGRLELIEKNKAPVEGEEGPSHHFASDNDFVAEEEEAHGQDNTLYWKIGALSVAGVVLVLLLALLVKSLFSGTEETEPTTAETPAAVETPAETGTPPVANVTGSEMMISTTQPTQVLVRTEGGQEALLNGTVNPGEPVILDLDQPVTLVSTQIENLRIQINGRDLAFEGTGLRRVRIDPANYR